MKVLKIAVAVWLMCLCNARANLIDVTPGGFQADNPPQVYLDWIVHTWEVTAFPVPTSLFTVSGIGNPSATVSWDMGNTGYTFHWLFVIDSSNPTDMNMYHVSRDSVLAGEGAITINGIDDIFAITPYGRLPGEPIPETGSALLLFAIGLVALKILRPANNPY